MMRRSHALQIAALAAALLAAAPAARATIYVSAGTTLRGSSVAAGTVVNHGTLLGEAARRMEFGPETRVSGSGRFQHTLMHGVFAPGNSPGVTTGTNQAFGSTATVEIELGGLTPGFGAGNHDQINDTATIWLFGGPTLAVLPFGGFLPAPGDQFQVITWQTGLDGSFGTMTVDPFFTAGGIMFDQVITNPTGAGHLTLVAVAIPELGACWFAATAAVAAAAAVRLRRLR